MSNLLENEVISQIVISVIGGFFVIILHYIFKKLYLSALAPSLSRALIWVKTRARRNRAKKLWELKNLRRDPTEVTRLTIKANTHFALFIISLGFFAGLILFLTGDEAIPTTLFGKVMLGSPVFFFEVLWLINHMEAEDLTKQRRKLFYRPKSRKGEKDKASCR